MNYYIKCLSLSCERNFFLKYKIQYILLFLFILNTQTYAGIYADIFTNNIYDQTHIIRDLKPLVERGVLTEKQFDEKLVEAFSQAKETELAKRCLEKIEKKITFLKGDYATALEREYWEETLDATAKAITSAGTAVGLVVGEGQPVGGAIGGLIGSFLSLPLKLIGENEINKRFPKQHAATIYGKIRDLELEILNLKEGIKTEPINTLESSYVKMKRKIDDLKLIEEIERGLLEARRSDYLTSITTQFVDLALKLPTQAKFLLNSENPSQSRAKLIEKFEQSAFFNNYEEHLRTQLLDIVTQAAADSQVTTESRLAKRKTYYLYGDPSAGKTSAARAIPKILDLPYFEMSIRSATELNQENLEGAERIRQNTNVGWLVRPFLEVLTSEETSFKNAFLIINDLDRVLAGMDPKSSQTALTFLLDYLDPEKKKFYSPFFRANIDISHLNIIITANKKMEDNFFFAALKTRIFKHIYFPRLKPDKIEKILNDYIKQLVVQHQIPAELTIKYDGPTRLRVDYNKTELTPYDFSESLLQSFTPSFSTTFPLSQLFFYLPTDINGQEENKITLRELQHRLDDTINHFKNQLIRKGAQWFREGKQAFQQDQTAAINLYMKAALAGQGDVCYELGKAKEQLNMDKAILWYKKGAERAHMESCELLARHHFPTNPELGKEWYEKALFLGSIGAENWLCDYYETKELNLTTAQNKILFLIKRHPLSVKLTRVLNVIGKKFEETNEWEKAYECYAIAIRHDHKGAIESLYKLGEKVERKNGLENETAKSCYLEAANNEHALAQFKLGWIAWQSDNFPVAFNWAKKSVGQNCGLGHCLLGVLYQNGQGVNINLPQALVHYKQAHKQQIPFAKWNIVLLHKLGHITESDVGMNVCLLIKEVSDYVAPLKAKLIQEQENEDILFLREVFRKSALEDLFIGYDSECFHLIGALHFNGFFPDSSSTAGKIWLRRAVKLGNKKSVQTLQKTNFCIII